MSRDVDRSLASVETFYDEKYKEQNRVGETSQIMLEYIRLRNTASFFLSLIHYSVILYVTF